MFEIEKMEWPLRTIGIQLFTDGKPKFLCIELYNYTIYVGRTVNKCGCANMRKL